MEDPNGGPSTLIAGLRDSRNCLTSNSQIERQNEPMLNADGDACPPPHAIVQSLFVVVDEDKDCYLNREELTDRSTGL